MFCILLQCQILEYAASPCENLRNAQAFLQQAKEQPMMDFITPVNMAKVQYTNYISELTDKGVTSAQSLNPWGPLKDLRVESGPRPEETLMREINLGNGAVFNAMA